MANWEREREKADCPHAWEFKKISSNATIIWPTRTTTMGRKKMQKSETLHAAGREYSWGMLSPPRLVEKDTYLAFSSNTTSYVISCPLTGLLSWCTMYRFHIRADSKKQTRYSLLLFELFVSPAGFRTAKRKSRYSCISARR